MTFWIVLGISIYIAGWLLTCAVVFLTGGEIHVRPGEWKWVWFNISIWPMWWLIFLIVAMLPAKKKAAR